MVENLINFKVIVIEPSEIDELLLKLARWFQVITKRDDVELRFWQFMTALRNDEPIFSFCMLKLLTDVARAWCQSPGLAETQRSLSQMAQLPDIRNIWRMHAEDRSRYKLCQHIRAIIGDSSLLEEIRNEILSSEISFSVPQHLAFLGTEDAVLILHQLAREHVETNVGKCSEIYLAILGQKFEPTTLRQSTPKHHVDLMQSMALATFGDLIALENLNYAVRTTSDEWLAIPFQNGILHDMLAEIGPIRTWLKEGVERGFLRFPERVPAVM